MRSQRVRTQRDPRPHARRVVCEREARVQGTFQSPSGRTGTMTGWLRLGRFAVVSGKLHAIGVFTGKLLDADGASIGVGSRRQAAPVEIRNGPTGSIAEFGPLEVDLLGLNVDVRPFTVPVRAIVAVAANDDPPGKSLSGDTT